MTNDERDTLYGLIRMWESFAVKCEGYEEDRFEDTLEKTNREVAKYVRWCAEGLRQRIGLPIEGRLFDEK